jgi:hypothetical protein
MDTNSEFYSFLHFLADSPTTGEFNPPAVDDLSLTLTGVGIVVVAVFLYIRWLKR